MQIRLNRRVEVPLRDQLCTQIILAIASGELHAGDKLPSTRELARRYRIHPNTVSATYQQLERERWVEARHGSGVYVADLQNNNGDVKAPIADYLIREVVQKARKFGVPAALLEARWKAWQSTFLPKRFLLVEPDTDLASIIIHEITKSLGVEVDYCSPADSEMLNRLNDALVLSMPSKVRQTQARLQPEIECIPLQIQSVQTLASMYSLVPKDWLVAVVSGWDGFLKIGRSMLAACGCDEDTVMFRNCREPDWNVGLDQAQVIICDSYAHVSVPPVRHVIVYNLLSQDCLAELRSCYRFFGGTLNGS